MDKVKFINNCNNAISIYRTQGFAGVKAAFPESCKEQLRVYILIGNLDKEIQQDYIDKKRKFVEISKMAREINRKDPIKKSQSVGSTVDLSDLALLLIAKCIKMEDIKFKVSDLVPVNIGLYRGITKALENGVTFEKIEQHLENSLWAFLFTYDNKIVDENNKLEDTIELYAISIFDIIMSTEVKKMKKQSKVYSERAKKAWETRKANADAKAIAEIELKAKRVAAAHKAWATIRAKKAAAEAVVLTPAQKAWVTRRANATK